MRNNYPLTLIGILVAGLNERFCCGPIVGGGVCPNAHRVPPSIPATQSPSPSNAQAYRFIHRSSCERDVTLGRLSLCQVPSDTRASRALIQTTSRLSPLSTSPAPGHRPRGGLPRADRPTRAVGSSTCA